MEDVYLNYVCYAILAMSVTFAAANLPVTFGLRYSESEEEEEEKAEAEGVWQVMLVVFLVYGMLPLKTAVAFCCGVALPAAHLAVSAAATGNGLPREWKWQQLSANLLVRAIGIALYKVIYFLKDKKTCFEESS